MGGIQTSSFAWPLQSNPEFNLCYALGNSNEQDTLVRMGTTGKTLYIIQRIRRDVKLRGSFQFPVS
jgi:hypothetical protein